MTLYFTPEAYRKVQALVENCETEIMGLGKSTVLRPNKLLIEDVAIFKQEATGASTEFESELIVEFMKERAEIGDAQHWRLWWHSHSDMDAFFSATDTENIDKLGKTADWLVSLVFNHGMEYKGRVDTFRPFRITLENVKIAFYVPEALEIEEWAKKEIKDKVETPKAGYSEKPIWGEGKILGDKTREARWEREDAEWAKIDFVFDKLAQGTRYDDLSKKEKRLVRKYPQYFKSLGVDV